MKFTFKNKQPADKAFAKVNFVDGQTEVLKKGNKREINVSVPKKGEHNLRKLHLLLRQIVKLAKGSKIKKLAINYKDLDNLGLELGDAELGELLAVQAEMANYEPRTHKTAPKGGWDDVVELAVVGRVSKDFRDGVKRGEIIANEVNACRDLCNMPGGEMTPSLLAKAAKDSVKGTKAKVKVLGVPEMKKIGMEGVLTVGKGSHDEPKFIIMEYMGGSKDERPVVLVGKGITFDTGGYNLKTPWKGMYDMHLDMSGGGSVIHAVATAAKLGLKKNIVGLVPAAENMIGGSAMRPGDIIKSYSGKTVEVHNTDAEGRLVLMDGLYYAGKHYEPGLVVDMATLTGAAVVALGMRASAIFTRDKDLMMQTMKLGEESGDHVWPMPLWEEYESEIKGSFGDIQNVGSNHPWGGSIVAAAFLAQFVKEYKKDTKWMHIDIAPTMTALSDEHLSKGAKGAPVRLLLKLIEAN